MSERFTRVERRTATEAIRDQLISSIRSGALLPGARLPAERALCEQLGVARTSVREAIQALVAMGYLERVGNRTHVVEHLPEVELDQRKTMVRELFETRRVIELPMTELAAARATGDQRSRIEALADAFWPTMGIDAFRGLDRDFHAAIAEACGNPLLSEVHGKVLRALFASDDFASLLYAEANRQEVAVIVEQAGRGHEEIAAAVVDGDAVAALAAAEAHLAEVERRMVERLV